MAAEQGFSPWAALIYLHAIGERDQAVAVGMGPGAPRGQEEAQLIPVIGHRTGPAAQVRLVKIT